jgi:hypothetical protein
MIGLCLRNRNTFQSPLPNFPRDDRLEPRAIGNNKATKRRFRQRMILARANSTDSLLLMFRLLKK